MWSSAPFRTTEIHFKVFIQSLIVLGGRTFRGEPVEAMLPQFVQHNSISGNGSIIAEIALVFVILGVALLVDLFTADCVEFFVA